MSAAIAARSSRAPVPDWVNTHVHHRFEDFLGRVVILLFWNSEDIHSINLLPQLTRLAGRFHDGVVLLAIHTPRYAAQRQSATLAQAARRLHLRVPVANDADWAQWRAWGIEAWPSAVILDCSGQVARVLQGESLADDLDVLVTRLLDDAAARDLRRFDAAPAVERSGAQTALRAPGGIAFGEQRLFVSDSGHNRILECTPDGRVLRQFGSGTPGYWDGSQHDAGFNDPQGLALVGEALYVADRGNHAVRRIRLASGQVETVLGRGRLGYDTPQSDPSPTQLAVSAPQAVLVRDNLLYTALAGQHQVWRTDLGNRESTCVAGSGQAACTDGPALEAGLVQPSALALYAGLLLIADAGGNALRSLRLADGQLLTLAGTGPWPGPAAAAADAATVLQSPAGVAVDTGGNVYVADTLGGRIVRLAAGNRGAWKAETLADALQEPGAVTAQGRVLWAAERYAHAVLRIDLDSGAVHRIAIGT